MALALAVVLAVVVLALLLRRLGGSEPAATLTTPSLPEAEPEPEVEESAEGDAAGGPAAITSDGWTFVPTDDRDRVRLVPPPTPTEIGVPAVRAAVEQLQRGDLLAARVRRGAPDHDPWRLEALGRDREYRAWRFETEDAARTALELVERRVVRAPIDEDGTEIGIGDEEFAAAKQLDDEIERELAAMPDVEPGERL